MLLSLFALPAFAALGGDLNSVELDKAHMKGSLTVQQQQAYSIHEIQASDGMTVREFVSSEGRVFGVAWQGPTFPDMKRLMGAYFEQYSTALRSEKEKHVGRRPINIQEPGLVVQTSGHMRALTGRAWVPELVPQNVKAAELR
jgi:hypothetical protein